LILRSGSLWAISERYESKGDLEPNLRPALHEARATKFRIHCGLSQNMTVAAMMNRPGFVGGSHFQIGWSRYEQNNEQILP
jgi:hypothetical protein